MLCVMAMLLVVITGCATVTPPKQPPREPVSVFVTDYGIHSSLILPLDDDGLYVEYAFGDFGYAALNQAGLHDALGALCWSFGSGFGRQYLRVPPGADSPMLVYLPVRMSRIVADRPAVKEVLAMLDARYNANDGPVTFNDITKIEWKRDKQHYSLFNNCNQLTADQFKTLGYQVHGPVFLSGFNVKGAEPVDPHAIKDKSKSPGGMSGSR